jgi:hypothetical protein
MIVGYVRRFMTEKNIARQAEQRVKHEVKHAKSQLASPRIELGVRDYETLVLPLHQEADSGNCK